MSRRSLVGSLIALAALSAALTPVPADSQQLYCTFFGNRAPEPQPALHNCSWFRKSSCCRGEEINITFASVRPLQGASRSCLRYFNSLMCYVCSPFQSSFYRGESLTVCEQFCEDWYRACGTAFIKGQAVSSLFESGGKLCESRQFRVSTDNSDCFGHVAGEAEVFAGAAARQSGRSPGTLAILFVAPLMRLSGFLRV